MKILVVSPYLPHPLSGHGTGVFMYRLLEHLTECQDVTLVSFCDARELGLARDVERMPLRLYAVPRGKGARTNPFWNLYLGSIRLWQLARSIVLWQPYYVSKWHTRRMAHLVKRLTAENRYDIVQFEFPSMAQYRKYVCHGKTVLHEHDVMFRPAYRRYRKSGFSIRKVLLFIEWCRWARYEPSVAKRFDHILSVTRQDKMLLEWLTGRHHISYFPRGVDVPARIPEYETRQPCSLLFVGTFSHYPNVDAVLWLAGEIFPLVQQRFPDAVLYVVGTNPPAALQSFAKKNSEIKVLGFAENISYHFTSCSVFVSPLRFGGGVKLKILHAMAHGIPVVTTKVGVEGIDGVDSRSVLVADSTEKLAAGICSLFTDRACASSIGSQGQELVRRRYSWDQAVSRLEAIYHHILASPEPHFIQ